MKIIKPKDEIVKSSRDEDQNANIWLVGEQLNQIKDVTYFGNYISSNGICMKDMWSRIVQIEGEFVL